MAETSLDAGCCWPSPKRLRTSLITGRKFGEGSTGEGAYGNERQRPSHSHRGPSLGSGLRDKDVDALRRTFRHFSFVREVRVFGSRARGIAREGVTIYPEIDELYAWNR